MSAVAHGVVENEPPLRAGRLREHTLRFRVLDATDLIIVEEIAYNTLMMQQSETLAVERDVAVERPGTEHRHNMRLGDAVGA